MDKPSNPAMGDNLAHSTLSTLFAGDLEESYRALSTITKNAAAKAEQVITAVGLGALAIADKVQETAKVAALVELLDDDSFLRRERAQKELAKMGQAAKPYLKELLKDPPSLEVKKRATVLYRPLETAEEKYERNVGELRALTRRYIEQDDGQSKELEDLGNKLADAIVSGSLKQWEQVIKAEGMKICAKADELTHLLKPLGIRLQYRENSEALSNGRLTLTSETPNEHEMQMFVSWGLGGPRCMVDEYSVGGKRKREDDLKAFHFLVTDALKAATHGMP